MLTRCSDLHRGNVLFWEETKGTQAMLYANLIDWGNIEWSTEDDDDTDEDLLEFLVRVTPSNFHNFCRQSDQRTSSIHFRLMSLWIN